MNTTLKTDKSLQNHTVYDVIISGAGPVGLFLACELALANCSVLILEKAENPRALVKEFPFGIRGLSTPTIESFYRRGLLDELEVPKRLKNPHANAVKGPRRQAGHFAGIPFHDENVDSSQWKYRLPSSPERSLISEMQELEDVLTRRAEALGVEIKRSTPITGFQQSAEDVTAFSDDQSFKAKWLVGCDGSRSVVRKTGGFEFAGTEPEFTGYSTKVDIVNPEQLKPGRNLTAKGMYLQSQPGYLAIQEFDGGTFHGSEKPITLEHIQEVIRRVSETDVKIETLHYATTWTDRARQATAYRNGRVFIAGDAAHIHAPLGGQGLNLGLGDAMNLGWKLAATIKNKAPEGLLDTYYTERHPLGIQVLDWSRAQVAVMRPTPEARAMNAILHDLLNTRDGATYIASRVWGIDTHYDLGGNHPLIGHSVPNFEFEDGTTIGELMRDGMGILLNFQSNDTQKSSNNLLKSLTNEYSEQIKYISGKAKEQLGLSILLIRPDGMIAWASDTTPDYHQLQQAMSRWFVSDSARN